MSIQFRKRSAVKQETKTARTDPTRLGMKRKAPPPPPQKAKNITTDENVVHIRVKVEESAKECVCGTQRGGH